MSDLREAAEMALEALETLMLEKESIYDHAIQALRQALAQPEQEPVAYRVWNRMGGISYRKEKPQESEYVEWDPLYTAPPKREWVGLTDEEVVHLKMLGRDLEFVSMTALRRFARDIAQTLKERNT